MNASLRVGAPDVRQVLPRRVVSLILTGAIVQIILSGYYLFMVHAPAPRDLPVGYVATDQVAPAAGQELENGETFTATRYASVQELEAAIRTKDIYGGVDLSVEVPHLYVASAAGPTAATAIRISFTQFLMQRTQQQVDALAQAGQPVPPATVQQLTRPPLVTDVIPLPASDSAGASLGLLVQALLIGATVAATGLGRIGPLTQRSIPRGFGHVAVLLGYAVASAAAVLFAAFLFDVVPEGSAGRLFLTFVLVSLAITGSVSGLVALIGPAGAGLGTAYFLFGLAVSGASILPEFLPPAGRILGQALPTGSGATAIRDSLYFPEASTQGPVTVLALYAAVGVLVVLITNVLPNSTSSAALLPRRSTTTND